MVQVINRDRNNPLLFEPIKFLSVGAGGAGPHDMRRAIKLLNTHTGQFNQREIYKHFINEGILRDETIKRPKLYFNKEDVQQNLISDIKRTTLGADKPDVADFFVLRVLKMGHLLKRYFSKPEIKEIKKLLDKDFFQIGIEENLARLLKGIIKELRRRNRVH